VAGSHWFNTPTPIELGDLRGRVVLVHAFQMLCPACVSHGLPQALRVHEAFQGEAVTVIGLHTVFEHHEVMGSQALQAFIQEYRLPFPIGIDQAAEAGPLPVTMAQWGLVARRVSCCSIGRAARGCIVSGLSTIWCWGLRSGSCWRKGARPHGGRRRQLLRPGVRTPDAPTWRGKPFPITRRATPSLSVLRPSPFGGSFKIGRGINVLSDAAQTAFSAWTEPRPTGRRATAREFESAPKGRADDRVEVGLYLDRRASSGVAYRSLLPGCDRAGLNTQESAQST
jgi:hypothetical protein